MRSQTGLPNRSLVDYYRATLVELGYEAELLATKVTGRSDDLPSLAPPPRSRPWLAAPLR